jgi:hypothetical protein
MLDDRAAPSIRGHSGSKILWDIDPCNLDGCYSSPNLGKVRFHIQTSGIVANPDKCVNTNTYANRAELHTDTRAF